MVRIDCDTAAGCAVFAESLCTRRLSAASKSPAGARGVFLFHDCDITRFDAKPFAEFAARHLRLLTELRHRFAEIKEVTGDRILRIGRHVLFMKSLEIVFHR